MTKGEGVYEQRRVDLATFRAVPASTWGHCPRVLLITIVWDTPEKEKVAKWSSAPASILEGFSEICTVHGPKKPYKTREKRQSCQIDPCLPPYKGRVLSRAVSITGFHSMQMHQCGSRSCTVRITHGVASSIIALRRASRQHTYVSLSHTCSQGQ